MDKWPESCASRSILVATPVPRLVRIRGRGRGAELVCPTPLTDPSLRHAPTPFLLLCHANINTNG